MPSVESRRYGHLIVTSRSIRQGRHGQRRCDHLLPPRVRGALLHGWHCIRTAMNTAQSYDFGAAVNPIYCTGHVDQA